MTSANADALQRFRTAYWRAYRELDNVRLRQWEQSNFTLPQLRVLSEIRRTPGTTTRDLSELLGVTVSTTSALVIKLVDRGFVERRVDAADHRLEHLFATNSGEEAFGELAAMSRSFLGAVGGALDQDLWGVTVALERLAATAAQLRTEAADE
jgi:DNA-binding MarR family transcriptional regulator